METTQNPASENPSSSPKRRRGWRILRRLVIGLACLATLLALASAIENWRGKRAWKRFQQEMAAAGEKLDLASLAPPPVPDEQNLAMIPLFEEVRSHQTDLTNAQASPDKPPRFSPHLEMPGKNGRLSLGSLQRGNYADLEACRRFYQGNTNYPQPEKEVSAAEAVLIALSRFEPELKQLADAAAARPGCRFPVNYANQFPIMVLSPHLALVKQIAAVKQLRAIARLELRQSAPALADLQVSFRLADGLGQEPLLISHLVRLGVLGINLQVIREGLVRQAWSDAQLAELDRGLGSIDLLAGHQLCMRGERAVAAEAFMGGISGGDKDDPSQPLFTLLPVGWFHQNMVSLGRLHQDHSLRAMDVPNHRFFPEVSERALRLVERRKHAPYHFFAALAYSAVSRSAQKTAHMQTYVDQARVACALERQRLAQGKYPDTLTSLDPRFLAHLPTDLFSGQPLKYRPLAEGGYMLYSIGLNQKDDDGATVLAPGGKVPDEHQGDWVWQMETKS